MVRFIQNHNAPGSAQLAGSEHKVLGVATDKGVSSNNKVFGWWTVYGVQDKQSRVEWNDGC